MVETTAGESEGKMRHYIHQAYGVPTNLHSMGQYVKKDVYLIKMFKLKYETGSVKEADNNLDGLLSW